MESFFWFVMGKMYEEAFTTGVSTDEMHSTLNMLPVLIRRFLGRVWYAI